MEEATRVPSNASASRKSGEFGFPVGHLGHLTSAQETALTQFKELCAEQGLYTPAVDGKPPSHNDAELLYVLFSEADPIN
jgi:hypothetical protein